MSYDISIGNEDFNYTYNLSAFFHKHIRCIDDDCNTETGLQSLHGKNGGQCFDILKSAFESIERERRSVYNPMQIPADVGDRAFLSMYDAKNGWGSTYGATLLLHNLMIACIEHPTEKVSIS